MKKTKNWEFSKDSNSINEQWGCGKIMRDNYMFENGFLKTDDNQYVKKISEDEFHVYDEHDDGAVFNDIVYLSDFSEDDMEREVRGYYKGLKEVKETYGQDWKQIVAEIIAEQSEHY